jgi:hypothetical protein
MRCSREACTNEAEGFFHIQLKGNYCRECVKGIDSAHRSYVNEHGSLFMPLKTREQCIKDGDDLFFISHPELWNQPVGGKKFVCMAKGDIWTSKEAKLGAMIEGDGPVVYVGNIFLGDFNEDRCERFNSYEELLQSGWKVD